MTQAFYLSITPLGQDRYLVRTEEVEPGVPLAEDQVTWPVETWLQQATDHNIDPLLSLLQEGNAVGSDRRSGAIATDTTSFNPNSANLVELGQSLYNALFQGRIRDSWLAAQGIAQHRRQVLSLRLGFKDSRLQRLPWEVLYGDDRPLATGTDIVFARYFMTPGLADLVAVPTLPALGQSLQVLMVVSAPDDQERLALRQEVQRLQEELHTLASKSKPLSPEAVTPSRSQAQLDIQLTILEQPGRTELVQALEQGYYQVLHYAGHSDVSETGGDLYLVSRQTGLTERLSGEDLAGLLVNNGIRLAVFNSCRGAYTTADDAESGWREQNLVQALVNRGVPGVIAMAERIPDDVAITFTQLLYRNLKQGHAIDLSLSRSRQGLISAYGSNQAYWMLPILYLHPEFDGYLYAHEGALADRLNLDLEPWLLNEGEVEVLPPNELSTLSEEDSLDDLLDGLTPAEDALDIDDLVDTYDEDEPSYDEDAAVVSHLIQQLSSTQTYEAPLDAPVGEDLLPDEEKHSLQEQNQLLTPLQSLTSTSHPTVPSRPAEPSPTSLGKPLQAGSQISSWKRWLPTPMLLAWLGLGLAGAIAAVAVAVSITREGSRPAGEPPAQVNGSPATDDNPTNSGTLVTGAIAAVSTNDLESARRLMERLLERGDTGAVQTVLDTARASQWESSSDLVYIRGRLNWEKLTRGNPDASIEDVLRDWGKAVKANPNFLDAWIALGFANYATDQPQAAITAWEKAIALDQRQVRDGDPNRDQLANPQVLNAYAGLAMAYQQTGAIAIDPAERDSLLAQARERYQFLADHDPTLLSPDQLSKSWLWQPKALRDWRSSLEALTTDAASRSSTAP